MASKVRSLPQQWRCEELQILRLAAILALLVFFPIWLGTSTAWAVTDEQLLDPEFWQRRAEEVRKSRDADGRSLGQRAMYCEKLTQDVNRVAHDALKSLYDRTIMYSPSGDGYISRTDYHKLERLIQTYSTVAYRDINTAMYGGADTKLCEQHADFAIQRINELLSRFPE